jgi:hypothetical protein
MTLRASTRSYYNFGAVMITGWDYRFDNCGWVWRFEPEVCCAVCQLMAVQTVYRSRSPVGDRGDPFVHQAAGPDLLCLRVYAPAVV